MPQSATLALSLLLALVFVPRAAAEELPRDLMADTWVATDTLGRTLPGNDECGPPSDRKFDFPRVLIMVTGNG
jgi:hypothetical protein